ncbi:MAG: M48 family metallopeptidase [Chthoniobacterales bacterium]
MKKIFFLLAFAFVLASAPPVAWSQTPSPVPSVAPTPNVPANADPATATRLWLDTVPKEKKATSDAYFEGGYWLILWNFLLGAAISIFLLETRISARIRDFAERTTRFKTLQVAIYALVYFLLTSLLALPLLVYEKFFREHAYGLATQTLVAWLAERMTELAVGAVAIVLLLVILYAVFRRAPRTWWIWGAGVVILFSMVGSMIAPIYIEPLFNKYKPLADPAISGPILALARANRIPVTQVFEVDASRQSNRVSANVAGFLGTTRIALNDNLLKQCSLPEIRHVMAHEMGHYVLHHMAKFMVALALIVAIVFALAKWLFEMAVARWGTRWQVHGIADPAGLPLLALIIGVIDFALTPINHTLIRVNEVEADAFALNAAREPSAAAQVALKLGTYRKLDPTPVEEFIFFDHPSGRERIRAAMEWKAANLPPRGE